MNICFLFSWFIWVATCSQLLYDTYTSHACTLLMPTPLHFLLSCIHTSRRQNTKGFYLTLITFDPDTITRYNDRQRTSPYIQQIIGFRYKSGRDEAYRTKHMSVLTRITSDLLKASWARAKPAPFRSSPPGLPIGMNPGSSFAQSSTPARATRISIISLIAHT